MANAKNYNFCLNVLVRLHGVCTKENLREELVYFNKVIDMYLRKSAYFYKSLYG